MSVSAVNSAPSSLGNIGGNTSLADIFSRNSTVFGLDTRSLAADLRELSADARAAVLSQLSPVQQGEVLRNWAEVAGASAGAAGAVVMSNMPADAISFKANDVAEVAPTVSRGQVTFRAEGNDNPRSPFFSRVLHWPGGESGVTIGRGYDMRYRTEATVISDLTASGVPIAQARQLAQGAGLSHDAAQQFVQTNRAITGQITNDAQINLFNRIYPAYETRAREVYDAKVAQELTTNRNVSRPNWDQLDSKVKTVIVDLVYQQGGLWNRQMPAIWANDRNVLADYIQRTPELTQYETGRGRSAFLRASGD